MPNGKRLARAMAALFLPILLLLTGCSLSYQPPDQLTPAQKMVALAKPAVVRPVTILEIEWVFGNDSVAQAVGANPWVMTLTSTGSGWFINPDGYVVTNAHVARYAQMSEGDLLGEVLFPQLIGHIESRIGGLTREDIQLVAESTDYTRISRDFFVLTPGGDRLGAEIKAYGVPVGEDLSGKDVAVLKVEGRNFPTLVPGDSDKVKIQDRIFIMGYPGAADVDGLLDFNSLLESSVSDGTVQARKNTAQGTPVIQIGGAANPGNSGGPVTLEDGQVVGILTFGKTENVNFMVPMNTIMEFVRQAGATPATSVTTTKFAEAMDLYWQGRYSKAIAKFEEILRLYPSHAEAKKYLQEAEARRGDEPLMDPKLMLALAGGALVIIVAVVLVIMAGKRRGQPAPAAAATAGGGPAAPAPAAPAPAAPAGGRAVTAYPAGSSAAGTGAAPQPPVQREPQAPVQPPAAGAAEARPPVGATAPLAGGSAGGTAVLPSGLGYLTFSSGPLAGQRIEVPATGFTLGREPGSGGLTIADSRISRKHCWIGPAPNGPGLLLVDQGSTNGTYVGSPTAGRIQQVNLKNGDQVFLGADGGVVFSLEI